MKKIFSIFAAALMSASMFASLENAPDDATLNAYAEAGQNLVYAIYVADDIKCNDIVLVGTYNGWTADAASCSTFVDVTGFDGWYVCCVADASEDIQAKPVQLDGAGNFAWDYQVGKLEQTNKVRGTATIEPGFSNECDIKAISDAQPLLINVTCWKANPCTAVYHDYVITLVSPDCNAEDYVVPAISGGFNKWAQEAMTMDELATAQRQNDDLPGAVFTITAHAAEGTEFKFRSSEEWGKDWTNELKEYVDSTGEWGKFNNGDNFVFGTVTEIEYDLGDPTKYTWTNCEKPLEEDSMDYVFTVTFPACEYVVPQIIGTFDGWAGTNMTATTNPNEYTIELRALPSSEYKFRDGIKGWDNELQTFNGEEWKNFDNMKFGTEATITLDYSDAATYQWTVCEPAAISEVKAANAAKKMIVNGQIVIVRDGAQFNVLGTEVK